MISWDLTYSLVSPESDLNVSENGGHPVPPQLQFHREIDDKLLDFDGFWTDTKPDDGSCRSSFQEIISNVET